MKRLSCVRCVVALVTCVIVFGIVCGSLTTGDQQGALPVGDDRERALGSNKSHVNHTAFWTWRPRKTRPQTFEDVRKLREKMRKETFVKLGRTQLQSTSTSTRRPVAKETPPLSGEPHVSDWDTVVMRIVGQRLKIECCEWERFETECCFQQIVRKTLANLASHFLPALKKLPPGSPSRGETLQKLEQLLHLTDFWSMRPEGERLGVVTCTKETFWIEWCIRGIWSRKASTRTEQAPRTRDTPPEQPVRRGEEAHRGAAQ